MIWFKRKKEEDFNGVDYTLLEYGEGIYHLMMKIGSDVETQQEIETYYQEFKLNLKEQYGIQ